MVDSNLGYLNGYGSHAGEILISPFNYQVTMVNEKDNQTCKLCIETHSLTLCSVSIYIIPNSLKDIWFGSREWSNKRLFNQWIINLRKLLALPSIFSSVFIKRDKAIHDFLTMFSHNMIGSKWQIIHWFTAIWKDSAVQRAELSYHWFGYNRRFGSFAYVSLICMDIIPESSDKCYVCCANIFVCSG